MNNNTKILSKVTNLGKLQILKRVMMVVTVK